MSTEYKTTQSSKQNNDHPVETGLFRDAPAGAQELAEQRERLETLKACDDEIAALEGRKSELEVACIEKEARLKGIEPSKGLDQSQAAEIADALHKKRKLEAALVGHKPEGARRSAIAKEQEQLKMGLDALSAWLDAPNAVSPQPILKVAYFAVMVAVLVVIWSAIFIHPVLLLVMLGLGVILAFLKSFNQNEAWVRLGAKRHFDATELKPPARWKEAAVRERATELKAQIEALTLHEIEPETAIDEDDQDEQDKLEQREVEFAMAEMHLTKLLSDAGLDIDKLDEHIVQFLDALAEARHVRRELERVIAKLRTVNAQRDSAQDTLYRFLAHQGEAPKGGAADYASLATGLQRVAARSGRSSNSNDHKGV